MKLILKGLFLGVFISFLVYLLFPFYWAINTSLMKPEDLTKTPVVFFPAAPSLDSYQQVVKNHIFMGSLYNSVLVAGCTTILSLILGSCAACALGRYKFVGRKPVLYIILAMTMFPQISIVGSLYELVVKLGLFNTKTALVCTYLLTTLPFTVWVLTNFFRSLPAELEEAAYVDGATPFQTFYRILLPLAAPGIVTSGILAFITSWNEYLFALTFTLNEKAKTVPVAIAQFSGESQFEIPWGQIMAGSLLATGPLILLVLIFQRRLISGMTAGAIKG